MNSKVKSIVLNLLEIRFNWTKDTWIAFLSGILVIVCSITLVAFNGETITDEIAFFIFRDIIMIFCLGFIFPIYYIICIKKDSISILGITSNKIYISLFLDIIFASLLLFQFIIEAGDVGKEILFRKEAIIPIVYIFVAGIFEMIFFYGFLEYYFEKAFGIVVGILLTAFFYSFHHAGFQPEFTKLFFVGIMYASIYRITRNVLIIFPFFWGVGAIWDVLVNFGAQNQLQGIWTLVKAIVILILMLIFSIFMFNKNNKNIKIN